jgi:hypothetical protein
MKERKILILSENKRAGGRPINARYTTNTKLGQTPLDPKKKEADYTKNTRDQLLFRNWVTYT